MDNAAFLKALTDIPHRAAGSTGEKAALSLLEDQLHAMGAPPTRHEFKAPRTYIPMIWWICAILALAMLWPTWAGTALALVMFIGAFLYFDWRPSFLTKLPPQVKASNLWATKGVGPKRLILMAHHDSAPISHAYKPGQVEHFRQSLFLGVGIMGACVAIAVFRVLGWSGLWAEISAILFSLALLAQALMASVDFWRFGYSNAANDNGTGVVTVLSVAETLWQDIPEGWQVDVLLTGAEEAGMIGAQAWLKDHGSQIDPRNTYVINIDTVGQGQLHYVTKTGTFTTLTYDNAATRALASLAEEYGIKKTEHRVADFDSVWFARKGIPVVTLGAYDDKGLMPNIHRPEDRLENVNMGCISHTKIVIITIIRQLYKQNTLNS